MPAPILTKTWNITPNLRRAFTSLADTMGWFFYQNKTAMLASGWTIKWTSDGTTGPSGAGDTTDRWTSPTPAGAARGVSGVTAQSYAVLQNSDGLQVLFAYQGASDDIGRLSFSPGGLFALATPSTNQPTASDEVIWSAGNSLVNATTNTDRLLNIWCTSDSKQWSCILFRAGAIVNFLGVERVISYCGTGVFNVPYVGYRYNQMLLQNNPAAGNGYTPGGIINLNAPSAAGFFGCAARVFTASASRIVRCGSGAINMMHIADGFTRTFNDRFFQSSYPALQGSKTAPLYPFFWMGEKSTNLDGVLGSPIDWWFCHSNTGSVPAVANFLPGYDLGDTVGVTPVRSNWLVSLGSECVRPWRNVAGQMLTS